MDNKTIRDKSIQSARSFGAEINPELPLLDNDWDIRKDEEIIARILAMNAVAAIAYGFDRDKAILWLDQEKVTQSLSVKERLFVFDKIGPSDSFKAQIEGMWTLAWVLGIVSELDFSKDCSNEFVNLLPNLKFNQSSADFRSKVKRRPLLDIVQVCDLAYCLHWAIRQSEITNKQLPTGLKAYVIIERRQALEWLLCHEAWEDVSLDT